MVEFVVDRRQISLLYREYNELMRKEQEQEMSGNERERTYNGDRNRLIKSHHGWIGGSGFNISF